MFVDMQMQTKMFNQEVSKKCMKFLRKLQYNPDWEMQQLLLSSCWVVGIWLELFEFNLFDIQSVISFDTRLFDR